MLHTEKSPLAGQSIPLPDTGTSFVVEDWWDRVTGKSWMFSDGNPAAMIYGIRSGMEGLPTDDEVLYGKVDGQGILLHVSEIEAGS